MQGNQARIELVAQTICLLGSTPHKHHPVPLKDLNLLLHPVANLRGVQSLHRWQYK